jgi:hypothetical protein
VEGSDQIGLIGIADGVLLADVDAHARTSHLIGSNSAGWRSGVKHDCAKVLELRPHEGHLMNALGESVDVETHLLYPLLKGSDVANARLERGRMLLVPQRAVGEDTRVLRQTAPKAWAYLQSHADLFARRKSSIYRNRPPFSIFGVGPYSFTRWKVAVSGLYKRHKFVVVPPIGDRPVVFDDTVYFTPCDTEAEAALVSRLLNSDLARDFFRALIFWDEKRPFTARTLKRLDLWKLADELGEGPALATFRDDPRRPNPSQLSLLG